MRVFLMLAVVGLAALLWPGCDERTPVRSGPGAVDTLHGPLENYEAEAIAINLSHELQAPLDLYARIRDDLAWIRETFSDSISAVWVEFFPTWQMHEITVVPDTAELNDTGSVGRKSLDSLNGIYLCDSLEYWIYSPYFGLGRYMLRFQRRYNPVRLIEEYAIVQGMLEMKPMLNLFPGDWPKLYVTQADDGLKYFFRDAWGDCPAGCIVSHIHYFFSSSNGISYVGSYHTYLDDSIPAWYDTVVQARSDANYWLHWYADSVRYFP